MMRFNSVKLSDIGEYRKSNQDYLDSFINKHGQFLGIVCDGMGGHAHGEVASKIAVENFINEFKKTNFNDMNNQEINKWLRKVVNFVLEEMIDYASLNPETQDMGTTLTAILVANSKVYVVNVGDSRTYKLVDDKLFQITVDQNLWNSTPKEERQSMREQNKSYAAYSDTTFWKVLTSALGPSKTLRIDTYFLQDPYGIFFLTTDGVHDYFDEKMVVEILKNPKIKLKDKASSIIENSKNNASTDNLSILILEVTK